MPVSYNPKTHLWALIMAGGSGERLWPLSRRRHPKQTLRLGYKKSLLQVTAERLRGIVPNQRTVVVTTKNQADVVRRQLPSIRPEHFLIEPASRNTAAAVGLGTLTILRENPEAVVVVAPADHVIRPAEKFHQTIRKAAALAVGREALVCLGVKPTYPATGFGYIEPMGRLVPPGGYQVRRFLEKPDLATAKLLLRKPGIVWNGGIFCWRGRVIMSAIRQWLPRLWEGLDAIRRSFGTPAETRRLEDLYRRLPSISIDVGVLERSRHVWFIPADFSWDDVGSWNSLAFLHGTDADGNVILGPHLGVETRGSIVVSSGGHLVATAGVDDLVVVHTSDATLVCHKTQAQEIRRIVARLGASRRWRKLL